MSTHDLKRMYYIINPGKIRRKDNTIFFFPSPANDKAENLSKENDLPLEEEIIAGSSEDFLRDEELASSKAGKGKPIPINDVGVIFCFADLTFNTKFFNYISKYQIVLHMFNYYGYFTGSFLPRQTLAPGSSLLAQVRSYLDPHKRLVLARNFVDGAAINLLKNLQYYLLRAKENTAEYGYLQAGIKEIQELQKRINITDTVKSLMGIEGNIRERYYRCWKIIIGDNYAVHKRVKNPPDNPINALISFANSLVYASVLNEIYHTRLDPSIGYLHGPGNRRYSLSLDISEIFKPHLADRLIFSLLNKKQIQEDHFKIKDACCYLNEKGRNIVLKQFDERMKTTIEHRQLKRKVSYRQLIRLEAYKLEKYFLNETEYILFHAWW